MFRIECKRALKNPFTYGALLVGIVICIAEVIVDVVPELEFLLGRAIMEYPDTVFDNGILFENSKFQQIYYTIIPLLAVIPNGISFYNDIESGYIRQIITREEKRKYYTAKFMVTFLSAGLITIIPLIINLMTCMALLPSAIPQPGVMKSGITSGYMMAELFFESPYAYTIIYLAIDFIISGIIAIFAVSISWVAFSKYLVMFTPFILYYMLHFILQYAGLMEWSPLYMLLVNQAAVPVGAVNVIVMILGLLSLSVITFIIGGRKHEVL